MDKIDKFLWLVCHAALTTLVVIVCVKLCTGCKAVKRESARASISNALQIAYEKISPERNEHCEAMLLEGCSKVAVSNSIERLVLDGKITSEQGTCLISGRYETL